MLRSSAAAAAGPPKALLCDVGGVVIDDNGYLQFFSRFESATGKSKEELYVDIVKNPALCDYERGDISRAEFWLKIMQQYHLPLEALKRIREEWPSVLVPIPGTIELLKELRGKLALVAVTNVTDSMAAYLRQKYDVYSLFDKAILSFEAHSRKPEPAIFQDALKAAGCKPAEAVFVDNFFENIAAAQKLGIPSIHFENPAQLRRELIRLGLPLQNLPTAVGAAP
ncbi:MAG TPA: HAD family phosphatase, partial [archaeon]|nr:HAD family phosphatase [archaeon]